MKAQNVLDDNAQILSYLNASWHGWRIISVFLVWWRTDSWQCHGCLHEPVGSWDSFFKFLSSQRNRAFLFDGTPNVFENVGFYTFRCSVDSPHQKRRKSNIVDNLVYHKLWDLNKDLIQNVLLPKNLSYNIMRKLLLSQELFCHFL